MPYVACLISLLEMLKYLYLWALKLVIFPGEEREKKLLAWSLTSLRALIAPGLDPKLLHLVP